METAEIFNTNKDSSVASFTIPTTFVCQKFVCRVDRVLYQKQRGQRWGSPLLRTKRKLRPLPLSCLLSKNGLCFAAHPEDAELGCEERGIVLLLYVQSPFYLLSSPLR